MYLSLAFGLVLLMLAGDLLVRGAAGLAARAGLSPLIIALTVVAIGTSMPELVISVSAALQGSPDIAIGNVVGSNIANILLILGLPALIYPIVCNARGLRRNTVVMLGTSLLLIALCFLGPLAFTEGLILIGLLVAYLFWSAWEAQRHPEDVTAQTKKAEELMEEADHKLSPAGTPVHMAKSHIIAFILVGCIGLPVGAHLVVEGGTEIARFFGVPDAVIALSLIAIGTSLPELATSLMAAFRHRYDLAIGNVVGSNIVNILGILGINALIMPLPVAANFLHFDLWVMLAAALVIMAIIGTHGTITRSKGVMFITAYGAYLYFIFHSGKDLV
ncbi:MAG: calcium/sodium antiporter [Parvibaculum sp.]|nr:calcium/sodium antiporter [Parvibaculum sp.]